MSSCHRPCFGCCYCHIMAVIVPKTFRKCYNGQGRVCTPSKEPPISDTVLIVTFGLLLLLLVTKPRRQWVLSVSVDACSMGLGTGETLSDGSTACLECGTYVLRAALSLSLTRPSPTSMSTVAPTIQLFSFRLHSSRLAAVVCFVLHSICIDSDGKSKTPLFPSLGKMYWKFI